MEVAKLRRAHYEGRRRVVLSSTHRLPVHVERSAGRLRQWRRRREIAEGWREIKCEWKAREKCREGLDGEWPIKAKFKKDDARSTGQPGSVCWASLTLWLWGLRVNRREMGVKWREKGRRKEDGSTARMIR